MAEPGWDTCWCHGSPSERGRVAELGGCALSPPGKRRAYQGQCSRRSRPPPPLSLSARPAAAPPTPPPPPSCPPRPSPPLVQQSSPSLLLAAPAIASKGCALRHAWFLPYGGNPAAAAAWVRGQVSPLQALLGRPPAPPQWQPPAGRGVPAEPRRPPPAAAAADGPPSATPPAKAPSPLSLTLFFLSRPLPRFCRHGAGWPPSAGGWFAGRGLFHCFYLILKYMARILIMGLLAGAPACTAVEDYGYHWQEPTNGPSNEGSPPPHTPRPPLAPPPSQSVRGQRVRRVRLLTGLAPIQCARYIKCICVSLVDE